MFVGMSIMHQHNKRHITPWNYSILIILSTIKHNYIQNSHAYNISHTIYIYMHVFGGVTSA
jgi:hypothetical protein